MTDVNQKLEAEAEMGPDGVYTADPSLIRFQHPLEVLESLARVRLAFKEDTGLCKAISAKMKKLVKEI